MFGEFATNSLAFNKLLDAENKLNNKTVYGKTLQTTSTGTNYYLDLNSIVHLQYLGLESFTIPVVRETDNGKLENLMISKNSDGVYTAKLLTYTLTTQEKNDLIVGNLKNIQHPIETELIEDFSTMSSVICGYSTVQVITSCGSGEHNADNIVDWVFCKSKSLPTLKTITVAEYCDNGGGSGGDGGNSGNPFGDDGGSGGSVDSDFPTTDTPDEDYEEGISEPTLSADVDGTKPGPKLKRPFECLNDNHLAAIFPNSTAIDRARLILKIRAYGEYFGIDSKEELAHFLGQIGQETGGLTNLTPEENLNYSAQGLINTWPTRFTNVPNHPTKKLASEYAHNPEKIANEVYGGRNGNDAPGHGWKYRARGVLQLTGRAGYYGYHQYLTSIGLGWFLTNVNDLADPADCTHSVLSGMWFFKTQALDKMTINANTNPDKVTEKVNYYTDKQSYLKRKNYTNAAKQHLPVCPTN